MSLVVCFLATAIPFSFINNMLKRLRTGLLLLCCYALLTSHVVYSKDSNQIKSIDIDITTHLGDVQSFQEGDTISFLISLDTDAHVLVIYENADGQLVQLLPNKVSRKSFLSAGLFMGLPDPDADFIFKVQPPFGKETLWAFALDTSLPELKGQYLDDGLKLLTTDISVIQEKLRGWKKKAYGEASLVIHTSRKE